MLHSLIETIKNNQPAAAKNNLFALKKYVPRKNCPDLPVARNIISQISIVQHYEQGKITRMIVLLKSDKQILVIFLIEQHKDKNDSNGKKSPTLYSPNHPYARIWGQDEFMQRS